MPHAQDREELGRCLPTFPPTFRRGRHRARRSRAAGLRDAHPAPAANQETPVGFRTEQITNAYRVHEPTRGLGLLAMCVFATGSNSWTPSDSKVLYEEQKRWLDPANPLHQALTRLERALEGERSRA
jgi:hypothetical protein